jgi:hypothetical protein
MNLYIQVENGQPINHPSLEENLIEAFGAIPENWESFVRIERPILEWNQTFEDPHVIYGAVNGEWTDVFQIRELTAEEQEQKRAQEAEQAKQDHKLLIDSYKAKWDVLPQRDNFSAWMFNEETIQYEPPIPRPTDREVIWHGASNSWVDRPIKPNDGKKYKIDFYTSTWVEVQESQ